MKPFAIALLVGVLSLLSPCIEAREDWEIVRPTILVITDASLQNLQSAATRRDETMHAIRRAIEKVASTPSGALVSPIESIVAIERQDGWAIALFRRGNGRMTSREGTEYFVDDGARFNPPVVIVERGSSGRVYLSDDLKAQPMSLSMSLGVATDYPDQSLAETHFNVSRKP